MERVWGFLKRHKRKFLFAGAVCGGLVVLARLADGRFREWQQQETEALLEAARREQHFKSTLKTCDTTIINLSASLGEVVSKLFDCDEITEKLKAKPDDRYRLFELLKTTAFARAVASIYATTAMVTMVRVQLSVLGGCMYADTVVDGKEVQVTAESQHNYLALVQHLIGTGCEQIAEVVRRSVESVMANVSLKERVKLADVQEKLAKIRRVVDGVCLKKPEGLMSFALPSGEGEVDGLQFSQLVRDTKDLFESNDCRDVILTSLELGFSMFGDLLAEHFAVYENGKSRDGFFQNPNEVSIPLAMLLAPINSGASCMFAQQTDHFVPKLLAWPAQQMLAANVYEAYVNPQSV